MLSVRRQLFPSIILLWVALLLPTLHFHPFFEDEHGNHEAHGHGVAHADFLAAGAVGNSRAVAADGHEAYEDGQPALSYQINFLTLASRGGFALDESQTHWIFFFVEAPHAFRPAVYSRTLKPDHPAPIAIFDSTPGVPRSPPAIRFAL